MMRWNRLRVRNISIGLGIIGLVSVVLGACGGGDATPTPTAAPATATPTRAAPTATSAPATATPLPTATPAPTPTPAAQVAVATPVINTQGKRGGVLQLSTLPGYMDFYDSLSAGGKAGLHIYFPLLNSLLWPDPYGTGLVGDVAERWEISQDGKVITFYLRQGIKFHDGSPLTSQDVAYNIERGWKPRAPTMREMVAKLQGLQQIETPDDRTVRLILSVRSNSFLASLGSVQMLMYPARIPFPERNDQWKQNPVGTGPFKVKTFQPGVRAEWVRNDAYWKQPLPYLDAVVTTAITHDLVPAAFRTGRLDAVSLEHSAIVDFVKTLEQATGFIKYPMMTGLYGLSLNRRPPLTDPRVREAIDLVTNRQDWIVTWAKGLGTPYAAPLLPPEFGGQWGIPVEAMKSRPGFQEDKTADLARAKQLLAQAGVDPAKTSLELIGTSTLDLLSQAQQVAADLRNLGITLKINLLEGAARTQKRLTLDWDIDQFIAVPTLDDPLDYLVSWVHSQGAENVAKWSNPTLDTLFAEQDTSTDPAKRKALNLELQETVLKDRFVIPVVWRLAWNGHQPWVKNFPGKVPFSFSPRWRWEQVWIER